jgi:hypothetical protein
MTGLGDAIFEDMSDNDRHATHDDTGDTDVVLLQYLHGEYIYHKFKKTVDS